MVSVECSAMAAVPPQLLQRPIVHVELCITKYILLRLGSLVLLSFLTSHIHLGAYHYCSVCC